MITCHKGSASQDLIEMSGSRIRILMPLTSVSSSEGE